jgi:hypothetical protein
MKLDLPKKKAELESLDLFDNDEISKILKFKAPEISRIVKWALCAKNAGIKVRLEHFKDNDKWNLINSTLDIEYYKIRYSKYDYDKIYLKSKSDFIAKRGSMYDPANLAKKNGISFLDAEAIVKSRKEKTKITKENLIKKYGEEEGSARFDLFVDRSKSTIDNYKKRYGDEWETRWNYFINTRDSSSLSYFIKKYGDDGEKLFEKKVLEFKKSSDIKYYIEKYGESEGHIKYNEICEKKADGAIKSWSLENFLKENGHKYDTHDSALKAFCFKNKKRSSKNIEYFISKGYSLDESKELRLKSIEKSYRNSRQKSPVSKESVIFFSELEKAAKRKCLFGSKDKEFSIKKNDKIYFYDFYDEKTNTIIEYNGSAYHAPELLIGDERAAWKSAYGLDWNAVHLKDLNKKNAAIDSGYNFIVVWDYDVRSKRKRKEKINEIINIIGVNNEG